MTDTIRNTFKIIFIDVLYEAYKLAKEKNRQHQISKDWFNVALEYNKIHTYSSRDKSKWMCPMCHKIHDSYEFSPFTGLQFPACCEYPKGNRLDKEYATSISNIKYIEKPTKRYKP